MRALPDSSQEVGLPAFGFQTGGAETVAYLTISSTPPVGILLHVGVIPLGGTYQEQVTIPSQNGEYPSEVYLAEAPNGAAVAAWSDISGLPGTPVSYFASYRAAGSSIWGVPASIAVDAAPKTTDTGIEVVPAISSDGTAAVGVVHDDPTIPSGDGTLIDVAVHPADGAWGAAAQQISPASNNSNDLSLGFDAAGNLTATFTSIDPGVYLDNAHTEPAHTVVLVSRPAATGVWTAPQDLTDSETDGNQPTLAVAPDGTAVVALTWDLLVAPLGSGTKVLTRIGTDGTWTEGDVVPMLNEGGDLPQAIGISPDDMVYVVYAHAATSAANDCTAVERARLIAGSAPVFSAPHCLSALNFGRDAANIAFIGNDAYLGWTGTPNMGTNLAFETSRWLESEAAPEPATDLATPALDLLAQDFMSDQNGSVAAIWTDTNDPGVEYDSAFDAGGPAVTTASVPTTAATGQPVTMSASFADLWSSVSPGGPTWEFGDGTTATGAQVTHTYATAGTYTVTVGASDTLGNNGSATYKITVTTPPATTVTTPPAKTPAAVKPELSAVKQSAARWRDSGKSSKGRPPVGTIFSFTLNTTATVRIAVTQRAKGRKSGKKCVKQTSKATKAKSCSLTVTITTLTVIGRSGANKVAYLGAIGKHRKLKPGTYTATFTATDTAGKSKTAKLKFTVLKA
jgi:PKD repeat protein